MSLCILSKVYVLYKTLLRKLDQIAKPTRRAMTKSIIVSLKFIGSYSL